MTKFSKIIRENNENILINKFIKIFKYNLSKKTEKTKRFSFVLTGGESPIKLYKKIAKDKNINWNKVDFFIGDERYVSDASKYSNIKMCKKYLLNKIKISKSQIFKIPTKNKSIKKDSIDYDKILKKYFKKKKIIFNLVLLGIGNDGHIASLFNKNIRLKCNKNAFPSTTSANCCFRCLVSPAKTRGGKFLIFPRTISNSFLSGYSGICFTG